MNSQKRAPTKPQILSKQADELTKDQWIAQKIKRIQEINTKNTSNYRSSTSEDTKNVESNTIQGNNQKNNYNSQPNPQRPSQLYQPNQQKNPSKTEQIKDNEASMSMDPTKMIKQMSQQQIMQILRDPEIARLFKESMQQEEKVKKLEQLAIEPKTFREHSHDNKSYNLRQVDASDPNIFGNEFDVPQEKTLSTEEFQNMGLLPNHQPKLYVGPTEQYGGQVQVDDTFSKSDRAAKYCITTNSDETMQQGIINFEELAEQSDSSSDPEDYDFMIQLQEGGEISSDVANFLGIHRMQDLLSPESEFEGRDEDDKEVVQFCPEVNYFCPDTGAHFHKTDLYNRIIKLKKRRAIIDRQIAEEDRLQKVVEKQQKNKILASQIIAVDQQAVKGPRNRVGAQLGGGRQLLTDGDDTRHELNQRVFEICEGALDSYPMSKGGEHNLQVEQTLVSSGKKTRLKEVRPYDQHTRRAKFESNIADNKNKNQVRSQERSSAQNQQQLFVKQIEPPPHEQLASFSGQQQKTSKRQPNIYHSQQQQEQNAENQQNLLLQNAVRKVFGSNRNHQEYVPQRAEQAKYKTQTNVVGQSEADTIQQQQTSAYHSQDQKRLITAKVRISNNKVLEKDTITEVAVLQGLRSAYTAQQAPARQYQQTD